MNKKLCFLRSASALSVVGGGSLLLSEGFARFGWHGGLDYE